MVTLLDSAGPGPGGPSSSPHHGRAPPSLDHQTGKSCSKLGSGPGRVVARALPKLGRVCAVQCARSPRAPACMASANVLVLSMGQTQAVGQAQTGQVSFVPADKEARLCAGEVPSPFLKVAL